MRDLLKTFRSAPIKKKLLIIAIFLMIEFSFIVAMLLAVGNAIKAMKLVAPSEFGVEHSLLYYAWQTKTGKPVSIILICTIIFLTLWLIISNNKRNFTDGKDEDGIHYMEQEIYGSARKMTKEEAKEEFNVTNAKDAETEIYGQFTDDGEEVVSYKAPKNRAEKNRNICICAPSGSGKSYTLVITNVLQHIKAGNSVVLTDPGGSTYAQLATYLQSQNIETHCLNFNDPRYSNTWNCLAECIDEDTERLSSKRLKDFAQTFMANVSDNKDPNNYFINAGINLLMMLIGYTAYNHEKNIIGDYEKLYLEVSGVKYASKETDEYITRTETEYISFKWCRQKIMEAALKNGYPKDYIENCFKKIHEYADKVYPFNITTLCENVSEYKRVEENLNSKNCELPKWHPAYMAYVTFKTQDKPDVKNAAIQNVQMAFNTFTNGELKEVISENGINLKDVNKRQQVIFVITSDKSRETKPIVSLFFSFMFYDIQDVYDKHNQLAFSYNKPNPCLPVAIFMDDFFSLGLISGDAETFATYMSDARKRKLYIILVIQNYKQFEAIYGEEFADSIQGNCSTLLCLGANDYNTAKFVSDLCGTATKLNTRHAEVDNALSLQYLNAGVQIQAAEAALVPPGDVLAIDNEVLVKKQGINHILFLRPMPWKQLPVYQEGADNWKETSVYTSIESYENKHPWQPKKDGEVLQEYKDVVDKLLKNLKYSKKYYIDFETGEVIERENAQQKATPEVVQNPSKENATISEKTTNEKKISSVGKEGAETKKAPIDIKFSDI